MSLHPIEASRLHARRERVFLVISGLFLGTLAMLNILGIMRFIHFGTIETEMWGPLTFGVMVGVLPYPITFLCTDLISELYGRARANAVVWVGLLLNLWVLFILWIGGMLPGFETMDPQTGTLAKDAADRLPTYFEVQKFAFGATFASMAAYLMAQFTDVWMFHFWKRLTKGRHLWLRNNASTLISQIVDTVAVILITYSVGGLVNVIKPDDDVVQSLIILMITGYVFKLVCALIDTAPLYWLVPRLSRWLEIDPIAEHRHLEDPGPESAQ
ncbi:MAG: transporter [Phycisphaerae bacterium]|nr:transporter [Phycisphaerae bacterium]|tara:strand:- start:110 stop:922 length:813 start_codon:yes stop_codon:yes gene_type:complete